MPMRRKVADRIRIQFLEADIESCFALVDEARAYRASGQGAFSARALREATEIVAEIERCLQRVGEAEAGPFFPLVVELRRDIAAVERER
jgi:hypothetical protein